MQRIFFAIVGVALAAVLIGTIASFFSYNNSTSTTASTQSAAVAIPFEELASGVRSSVPSRVNYLITSSSELVRLWAMLGTPAKVPPVDFSKNEVVAVFAGQKPTTGYTIVVSKIQDDGAGRMVTVDVMEPNAGCATAQSLTEPYQIVQVPKTSLPFTHEDQTSTTSCGR